MTAATGLVDEYVKEYLAFRGLSSTLRTLENELKSEKEKGFRVDKMVDQLHNYILTHDLANLREYWNFLANRLFSRLEQRYATSVRKLEVALLKFYIVNAAQSNQQDKILEFFERMTELLQTMSEFKEWFAFPFVRNPEGNSHYSMYFTKQWQESFLLSLHNFLSVVLQCMQPALLNFEADYKRLKEYGEENDKLKQQLLCLGEKPETVSRNVSRDQDIKMTEHNHMELIYDFSSLGEEVAVQEPSSKSPRKFPFTSSPLNIGKKSEKQQTSPARKRDDQIKMTNVTSSRDPKTKAAGGKLLPVITRQKKAKSVGPGSSLETGQTTDVDAVAGQKSAELAANQRLKKYEDAKNARKELLETQGDTTKAKDDKQKHKETTDVAYNRSVSEPASAPVKPKLSDSPRASTVILESKHETVGPLVSASINTMMSTSVPITNLDEQQGSPSSKLTSAKMRSQTLPAVGELDREDKASEKPFLLLSQDEYTEHRSAVSYARFSNSGQYTASVDIDGVVKVWTWSPQASTSATVMSKSAFISLEWANKSDRWLLLGNRSGNIRLFDVREMKSFYEASGDSSYPRIIKLCSNPVSPTFVCSATTGKSHSGSFGSDTGPGVGSRIGKLTLWDLKTMKSERHLPLEPGPVCINSCAFNHNGHMLVTGGVDGVIRLFDVSQQRCITHWSAHQQEIKTVLFSSDYTACYSLGTDGKLIEWSVHKCGHKIRELSIHSGAVPFYPAAEGGTNSSKETPMGNLLALDGEHMLSINDTSAPIYKMQKTDPGLNSVMILQNSRSSPITTVDWSPNIDTKVCLTGCLDGTVTVSTLLSQ